MRVILHYIFALLMLSVYGLQVCPFISTLQADKWALTVTGALLVTLALRPWILKKCFSTCALNTRPVRQFTSDFGLFVAMGVGIGLFNMYFFEFPLASAALVVIGTTILGIFVASDLTLDRQYETFMELKESGQHLELQSQTLSMPKRFTFIASTVTLVIAILFPLVFIRDLDWILTQDHSNGITSSTLHAVLGEVLFIVVAVMLEVLNLIISYARNLGFLLNNQNMALQEVASGNLHTTVQVSSNDEFGVMAKYTDDMIESLRVRTEELYRTQDATIVSLASLAETRDNETGQHILRTQRYIRALAEQLTNHEDFKEDLTPDTIELLFKSAPLHDVGKVGVPDAILLKPGKLDEEEWIHMRSHTTLGYDALKEAEQKLGKNSFLYLAAEIALTHHERWDGNGYPNKLKENDIPLSGRLMALADVYDALISKRVYKPAFSHNKARDIILEGRGNHFDPRIVDAFIAIEEKFKTIAATYKDAET